MVAYRCYFIGMDGKIKRSEVVECPTDAAALQDAEMMLPTCGYPGIEVWDGGRRVGTVGRSKDQQDAAAKNHEESAEDAMTNRDIRYVRRKAEQFRQVADEYQAPMSLRLLEVAEELERVAVALEKPGSKVTNRDPTALSAK